MGPPISPRAWFRLSLLTAVLVLSGCSGITDTLGLTRPAPNEFTVTTRAPLQMPSSFTLPPPVPGEARPQELPERRQAEAALVPTTALAGVYGESSPGQQAIVRAAGPKPPPNIRQEVDAEASLDKPPQTFTDQLMFWKSAPQPGTLVDATKEAQRLRENAALGQSPERGDTPIVQPKRPSILGEIF